MTILIDNTGLQDCYQKTTTEYGDVEQRHQTATKSLATLPDIFSPENDPPISVLRTAIESIDLTHPITLSVDLSQTIPQSAFFVLYFTETTSLPKPGDSRIIQIYINGGEMKSTVTLEFNKCKVITLYPVIVVGPTINVTLSSASGSTLPPIISAMEVFRRVDHEKSSSPPPPPSPASHGMRGHFFCTNIIIISCICLFLLLQA